MTISIQSVFRFFLLATVLSISVPANAQNQLIPNFWHPGERLTKPDLTGLSRLRFLTTTDFPPFNFIDRRKRLTGFHVDLARAICAELSILEKCEIQALPWDELEKAMEAGDGDAIISGLAVTEESRGKYEFSRPFLHIPARFAARLADGIGEPMDEAVIRGTTGLVAGSRHARWFASAFDGARTELFPTRKEALAALKDGKVSLVFADAVSLAFWLPSEEAGDCCGFAGGPYFSPPAFGQGLAIAFAKDRGELAAAANFALKQINDNGIFAELYLRYFPLSLY